MSASLYLKLAQQGREIWNRWALASISEEDRREFALPQLDPLSSAEEKVLRKKLQVEELPDPTSVHFSNLAFSSEANFSGFIFPSHSGRDNKHGPTVFARSQFKDGAKFDDAIFVGGANFEHVKFENRVSFKSSIFGGPTKFSRSTFTDDVYFEGGTQFLKRTYFDWCQFEAMASFHGAIFRDGGISFNNAAFKRSARFFGAMFNVAPEFHEAGLPQDTTFTAANFEKCVSYEMKDDHACDLAVRAFQTLKLKMNQFHSHEEEMRFFSYEMRARAKNAHWARKVLIKSYGIASDYGRSIMRPFIGLSSVVVATLIFNLQFLNFNHCWSSDCSFSWEGFSLFGQAIFFTISSSVPFVGQSKMANDLVNDIFVPGAAPWIFSASIVQGFLSAAFLFLMFLALRNLFRMK